MIKKLELKNFKCFENIELNFSNLNLLTGINSAGKSSIIQSILLIKQTFENKKGQLNSLKEFIENNDSFLKASQKNKNIFLNEVFESILGEFDSEGDYINIHNPKALLYNEAKKDFIYFNISFEDVELLLKVNTQEQKNEDGLSLTIENTNKLDILKERFLIDKEMFLYLSANRIVPEAFYPYSKRNISEGQLGNKGEYSVHYLNSYKNYDLNIQELKEESAKTLGLLENVLKWMGRISQGIDIETRVDETTKTCNLLYSYGKNKLFPESVGFGITYSLPIIVALLKAKKGDILIIENPESHLHPSAQVEIANLCCKVARNGVQLIIETHSDHFLNAVRVAVKEKIISNTETKIYFFTTDNKEIYVDNLNLDDFGKVDKWPKGFFDEWDNQLEKLLW